MTAPEDCPACDKPSLRDGVCPCGFVVPAPNVKELPDDTAARVGLEAIARIRRQGKGDT